MRFIIFFLAPGDPPQNVTLVAISESEIYVSWEPPSIPNGIITRYTIELTNIATGVQTPYIYVGRLYTTLNNSLPNTLYKVRVRAETSRGIGPFSQPVTIKTQFIGKFIFFYVISINYGLLNLTLFLHS